MTTHQSSKEQTWARAHCEASWHYDATPANSWAGEQHTLEDPIRRARWFSEVLGRTLDALRLDAIPQRVEVTTATEGEDAYATELSPPDAVKHLLAYLANCVDFCQLWLELSPRCVAPGGAPFVLHYGMDLIVDVEEDEANAPIYSRRYPFRFLLRIRTSLFTEATFNGSGDNRAFARANRPVLSRALQELAEVRDLRFVKCESQTFPEQIRPDGFADLRQEYRAYEVTQGSEVMHAIGTLDHEDVLLILKCETREHVLAIQYEVTCKLSDPLAQVLILEHFVAQFALARQSEPVELVSFENPVSGRTAAIVWPR